MRTPQRRGGASGDHQPPAVPTRSSPARSGPPSPRNFGEEGGLLTYGGYLRLPDLLALQVPQASPPAHDELLFITVHQVYELWFGQLLRELAADRGRHDDLWQLAEDLLTHDELAGLWRARHVTMVERQIGTKSGTGGLTGAPYLRARVPVRYYPLLWELRDFL